MADAIHVPNAQGHNFIPFPEIVPGVENLRQIIIMDQDPVTLEWTVVRDVTGWTSPRIRLYTVNLVESDDGTYEEQTLILEFAAEFAADPLLGTVNYTITADHTANTLIPSGERRYGQSVDAISPDGDRVPLARGNTYLGGGSK